MGKNPFKGLYYYEEADKDIFFGRDDLSRELFKLVASNALTLVFGKSGIGKTSLLNAGLFPLLRAANFLPVRLRLDYSSTGAPLLDQVKQELQKQLLENKVMERVKGGSEPTPSFSEGETLWEYFHRVDHINKSFCGGPGGGFLEKSPLVAEGNVIPVLVFDQFEELFTIGKRHPQRDLLIEALNDLVEGQIPSAVKERILSRAWVFPYLRSQLAVRVVFGLREDYLPHMNALKPSIPSIHRVMFRVIHLNGFQAREVLDRTGAFANEGIKQDILRQFDPVDLDPGQTVDPGKLEVEPALLSLLCYQVFEQGVESLSVQEKDAILSGFYDRVLSQLPRGSDLAPWIEDHLLTEGGFRTPFYLERGFELKYTVEAAIDKKLLRKLFIGEKEHVEIIHDVLAPVIKERRNRRMEEKKRLELEKELRRRRLITGVISVAFIIATIFAIFAFIQKKRADEQYKEAINQRNRAEELYKEAVKQKKIAEEQKKEAINQRNRADEQYRNSVSLRLALESSLALSSDNVKAIRIAEAAYKIGGPNPAPAVKRALSSAVYSTRKRPFYTFDLNGHTNWVNSAVFSPEGKQILTASRDNTAKLWDLQGNLLADFKGHTNAVISAVFSPDGKQILTASYDNTVKLWDLKGNLLPEFMGDTETVRSAVFSPDGDQILTAPLDNTAKLWDLKGNLLAEFKGHTERVNSVVFSPDGKQILTASEDNTEKLWDLKGNLLAEFKGHTERVNSVVFSPDGKQVLTASSDKTAKLWDLKGNLLTDFKRHTNSLTSAVFSLDGKQILTASRDKTAKLWDLKGNLLADFKRHTDWVNSAVFSSDGKRIVTASSDETAIVWPTPAGIMDWLKTAPIPKLTQKEKEELGIADFEL
jgi:WD40 repeat protein